MVLPWVEDFQIEDKAEESSYTWIRKINFDQPTWSCNFGKTKKFKKKKKEHTVALKDSLSVINMKNP